MLSVSADPAGQMRPLQRILDNNEKWALGMHDRDPEFFRRLERQQAPELLWVGCSDSRVPANVIAGLMPGEVFVHRNIANVVDPCDPNCLAVIQFAASVLGIGHIVVVGHYGCGGVKAALDGAPGLGLVEHWLAPVREVAREHAAYLSALPDGESRSDRLCELNVIGQVRALADTAPVRDAWAAGRKLSLDGWIYGLRDGRLRDLNVTVNSVEDSSAACERAVHTITRPVRK